MPVQNLYTSNKSRRNSKITFPGRKDFDGMQPSAGVVRNLVAYATALLIVKTHTLGNVAVILN